MKIKLGIKFNGEKEKWMSAAAGLGKLVWIDSGSGLGRGGNGCEVRRRCGMVY